LRFGHCLALLVTASLTACFPRPLDMHVQDAQTGAPIEGVALHKHAISLLSLLPSRQEPVQSQADGSARVWVPPLNTNITLLRPGYEPASVAVFKKEFPASMQGDSDRPRLLFDNLKDGAVFEMRMKPCTRTPMEVRVVDSETGQPVEGAEVLARTFLYLPAPGLEEGWGFPDMQCVPTEDDGLSKIEQVSGFRNRITARMAGRADANADLSMKAEGSITLRSRRLKWKPVRFEILDEKEGTPVPGAWISLEEPRNGLPPDPNAFAACTGPDGLTPPIELPDVVPLVVEVRCPGHRDRREALDWKSVGEGDIRTIWIRRKGWFE
jgi:hypothetical protein